MTNARLSETFGALADLTRAILERLASGETSVKQLASPFAMSLPARGAMEALPVAAWGGLFWRDERLRALILLRKE